MGYDMDPPVKHRIQERPSISSGCGMGPSAGVPHEVLASFETMHKAVKSFIETVKRYSPPGSSPEETTKNPGAVDKWTPDEEILQLLVEIDKIVERLFERFKRYSSPDPSPEQTTKDPNAVDTSSLSTSNAEGYDMDLSAERRSGEQPDSQVISSEQTRKGKGAVDDMHKRKSVEADTDDTRKRKSGEVDNDDTRNRKRAEADTDE